MLPISFPFMCTKPRITCQSLLICICNFVSTFQPFHGKEQVLAFFSSLMKNLGNNIEFVVQPTFHEGMNVGIPWKLARITSLCERFQLLHVSHLPGEGDDKEEARKALESALGGKKTEFEKWDKEMRREQAGGGGHSWGGGWFRWFGGSNGEHFWQEAQQTSLTILSTLCCFFCEEQGTGLVS